ncbi:MAG: methylated-DNA--[protein]-cysteine S-methyltransferase [Deltaproteobacteria bacterium]|nr:methylated-DNA--[protein]-cysteine S-methyltransferase [Deltaproteobacteria bacterium]
MYYDWMESPLGDLLIVADESALRMIRFSRGRHPGNVEDGWHQGGLVVAEARRQLDEYFAGGRKHFDLPVAPAGTPFQLRAWRALQDIPYGETRSYGEQARALGRPAAVRAVGAANGHNPIPIVIPCHRVIGGDGRLTGYAGGLDIKKHLLDLERRHVVDHTREVPAGPGAGATADLFGRETEQRHAAP